jgi:hypothetical protein
LSDAFRCLWNVRLNLLHNSKCAMLG